MIKTSHGKSHDKKSHMESHMIKKSHGKSHDKKVTWKVT